MVDKKANERVQKVLQRLVDSGDELGLQVAAYHNGELVIDTWAGVADESTGRKVDGDTLFTVFSTTKGVTATAVHILAEKGKVDYDAPIAKYWPEFAANGKAKATVRHGLTHAVGIPMMPDGVTPEQMCNWDWMCKQLAAMAPAWEPGTKTGYHAYTYGWILGEVIRRVDGRPIAKFVQDEICKPLGITDIYMGIPDSVEGRVATLKNAPPPPNMPPRTPMQQRSIPDAVGTTGAVFNRKDVRRASIPGAGGIMSARALAKHYAVLAGFGTLGKVKLMSKHRVEQARSVQWDTTDVSSGMLALRGMGYFLGGGQAPSPMGTSRNTFGHPGAGGSIGFADPENKLAVGFTKTLLKQPADPKAASAYVVAEEIRAALGIKVPAAR
jgi:CubicO group peptidase (beta-lactamase class C family)